jgi:hypothetical protein
MFHDAVETPGELSTEELVAVYERQILERVEAVGRASALSDTDLDPGRLDAVLAGDVAGLTLADGAALLALEGAASAEEIAMLARDALLMGMTTAVMDVEKLAGELDSGLTAREIQAKVEGRFPMTLREFAQLHGFLSARTS